MAAKPDDKARQIKQMVNFIMQEAHEKCNELKIKVKSLFLKYLKLHRHLINLIFFIYLFLIIYYFLNPD